MEQDTCERKNSPYLVPALARGLRLIETLAGAPEGLTTGELGALELPPATLFRLLETLIAAGYAVRSPEGRFRLTGKLLRTAAAALADVSLIGCAEGAMRRLRDRSGESVMLAVLHHGEGVVVHQVSSPQPVKVLLDIGHRFPLHSAAPAKAILAFLPPRRLEEILAGMEFPRFTDRTIVRRRDFEAELAAVRASGVAFDRGEELADIRCAAAPIFNGEGQPAGALWICAPASRMPDAQLETFARWVRESAGEISRKLG